MNNIRTILLLLTACSMYLSGCSVTTSAAITAVTKVVDASIASATSYDMLYVKADNYDAEGFKSDSICARVGVTGGVNVKARRPLEKDLQAKVEDALRSEGFDLRNDTCDVHLIVTFKTKQIHKDDEPQTIAMIGYGEKNGKRVYAIKAQRFSYAPFSADFLSVPAKSLARMRALYANNINLSLESLSNGSLPKGMFFRKADSYAWSDIQDDTVFLRTAYQGDVKLMTESNRKATYNMLYAAYNNAISDADMDEGDADVKVTVEMKVKRVPDAGSMSEYNKVKATAVHLLATKNGKTVYEIGLSLPNIYPSLSSSVFRSTLLKSIELAKRLEG